MTDSEIKRLRPILENSDDLWEYFRGLDRGDGFDVPTVLTLLLDLIRRLERRLDDIEKRKSPL